MSKPIITNINELRKKPEIVMPDEDVSKIIADLKETLISQKRGWGLSANQIGYNKKISYIRMPTGVKDKKLQYFELIMINPKIIEHEKCIRVNKEECLSFPGILVDTDRYVFITVEYENEKREKQTELYQDLQALCIQHETDHCYGRTIFDRKHKRR